MCCCQGAYAPISGMAKFSKELKETTGQRSGCNGMLGCTLGVSAPCASFLKASEASLRTFTCLQSSLHSFWIRSLMNLSYQNSPTLAGWHPYWKLPPRMPPTLHAMQSMVAAIDQQARTFCCPCTECVAPCTSSATSAVLASFCYCLSRDSGLTCMQVSNQCICARVSGVLPRIKAEGSSKMLHSHMQAVIGISGTVVPVH